MTSGDADMKEPCGGERRFSDAASYTLEPNLLLFNEATKHIDAESVGWNEKPANYADTLVATTHDCAFLQDVAGCPLELDRGHDIPYKGSYSRWSSIRS